MLGFEEQVQRFAGAEALGSCTVTVRTTAAEPVDVILRHLGLPATPPPLFPARGPPQHDLDFDADSGPAIDQTPAYDPTEPEPVPDYDFDQSAGV